MAVLNSKLGRVNVDINGRKTTVAQGCFKVICFAFFMAKTGGPFSRARSDDVVKFGFGALIRRATKRRTADFADLQP